jgi:EAL domain-containing protein (putative c-di-GMP-specific phosphodiesterase class I)
MIAAINQIGKVMNIKTIAEHVENVFTLNQLKEIGIDYAQGYYLQEPVDINKQIEKMLSKEKQRAARA